MTDIGTDGTRQFYWRYNHPLAIAEKAVEQAVPQLADVQSPVKRAALTGELGVTAASLGTFDVTNPGVFRPKVTLKPMQRKAQKTVAKRQNLAWSCSTDCS